MRSAILTVASVLAAMTVATSANAANLTFTEVETGVFSTFFGATHSTGGFDDTYTFDLSGIAATSLTLSAAVNDGTTNLTFDSVLFNGTPVPPRTTANSYFEFKDMIVGGGSNTLLVSGSGAGSYSGTIKYVLADNGGNPAGAVPEPISWAMMVGGFGMMGGALRVNRRRKVSFNFA